MIFIISFLRTAALYSVDTRNIAMGLGVCMDEILLLSLFFTHLLFQLLFLISIYGTGGRAPGEEGMKQPS